MPKFIKNIHDRINFLIKKGQSGFVSPDTIDAELHAESMNLWKKLIDEFEKTTKISSYLDPFKEHETVAITSGAGTIVSAFQYPTGVFDDATGKQITIVDIGQWGQRLYNPISFPTTDYPICRFAAGKMIVSPVTITSVTITFIKYPSAPKYAFSIVGSRYVYDDAGSTDFEWPQVLHDEIINRVLANLGINMREGALVQYSNQEKLMEEK